MNKVIFFDCDQTIWFSKDADFISSLDASLVVKSTECIQRLKDKKTFCINKKIYQFIKSLSKQQEIVIGIISDNKPHITIEALKLFEIWPLVNKEAIDIKLWKGYCPKIEIIQQILKKNCFKDISNKEVYFFDDKDYAGSQKNRNKFLPSNKTNKF
jgi:HAD superfamily phosphatase (TIGR01681 family)